MVRKPRVIFKGMKSGSKMSRFPTDFPARHPHQFYLGRGVSGQYFSELDMSGEFSKWVMGKVILIQ